MVKTQGLPTADNAWELVAQTLQAELAQLQNYADALNVRCIADASDAERYRWLRRNDRTGRVTEFWKRVCLDDEGLTHETLDLAIDAEMVRKAATR